jgi:hypothetical protein
MPILSTRFSRIALSLLAALSLARCAASARPERDTSAMDSARDVPTIEAPDAMDANSVDSTDAASAMDTAPSLPDALDDLPVFADGAECRMGSLGFHDCRAVFERRVTLTGFERFICCAGRCYQGLSCFVEDPTRARCDLAEAPCADDQVCCEIAGSGGRANCVPRTSPTRCYGYVDRDANP